MTVKTPDSRATSVRQRLLNLAKAHGEEFQRILTRYALERLLYRLSVSDQKDRFLLKGALLLAVWSPEKHRPTKDLDLMGRGDPSRTRLEAVFRALCAMEGQDDGITYLAETVVCAVIREESEYGGLRITLAAKLGTAEIPVQVDVGFGDAITPAPVEVEFPTLLNMPAPRLYAYPKETVVAEKFEAMVSLELGNSRMKDFFDVWMLARDFPFDGATLSLAIEATFARRGTSLPLEPPVALTSAFGEDSAKQMQWQAFRRRLVDPSIPDLGVVIGFLADFLQPILDAMSRQQPFTAMWFPDSGWQTGE